MGVSGLYPFLPVKSLQVWCTKSKVFGHRHARPRPSPRPAGRSPHRDHPHVYPRAPRRRPELRGGARAVVDLPSLVPISQIKILSYKEKDEYNLISKYNIGKVKK
jgi:hypothetical protein